MAGGCPRRHVHGHLADGRPRRADRPRGAAGRDRRGRRLAGRARGRRHGPGGGIIRPARLSLLLLMTDFNAEFDDTDFDGIDFELQERQALRRVAGLSTELTDVTEVEYRQLRLERVVLVGVWTSGSLAEAENSLA